MLSLVFGFLNWITECSCDWNEAAGCQSYGMTLSKRKQCVSNANGNGFAAMEGGAEKLDTTMYFKWCIMPKDEGFCTGGL
jgi:hypothetical protein